MTNQPAPQSPEARLEYVLLDDLLGWERNPKDHDLPSIKTSMKRFGFTAPVMLDERTGRLVAGHGRLDSLKELRQAGEAPPLRVVVRDGKWFVPVIRGIYFNSDAEVEAYLIADNQLTIAGGWDTARLGAIMQDLEKLGEGAFDGLGFDQSEIDAILSNLANGGGGDKADQQREAARRTLAEMFIVPPFSVLDARQGYWQDRKRAWIGLGIRSEIGRGENLLKFSKTAQIGVGGVKPASKRGGNGKPLGQAFTSGGPKSLGELYASPRKTGATQPAGLVYGAVTNYQDQDLPQQTGTSIFDPVLCEVLYKWFCPTGGAVLDPFAGGSVRGIVAGYLGNPYLGIDLSADQVEANRIQAEALAASLGKVSEISDQEADRLIDQPEALTPIDEVQGLLVKRDDLFSYAGVRGGKVRTCLALAKGASGLVTAVSRASPQVNIVAHVGAALGLPVECHTPQGDLSPEVAQARSIGAKIVQHKAGYNNVIIARAREAAQASGFTEIPFGMECEEAVTQTRRQVANLPFDRIKRIVIPVGSGMSLAGLLWGLQDQQAEVPVLGVVVGADPGKRLEAFAPPGWKAQVKLVRCPQDYHTPAPKTKLGTISLDPHYEAKCLPYLEEGDLLWVVGLRATSGGGNPDQSSQFVTPAWVQGDSLDLGSLIPEDQAFDFVFSCPPYHDLEQYSEDPKDLSSMAWGDFCEAYKAIIKAAVDRLAPDRFACFVVGEIRYADRGGFYKGFVPLTIEAFEQAGAGFYNEAIIVTAIGSLPIRVGKQFTGNRKLGKTHQNVLIFFKGDPAKIKDLLPATVPVADLSVFNEDDQGQ